MGASMKEIKNRIKSVQSTRQVLPTESGISSLRSWNRGRRSKKSAMSSLPVTEVLRAATTAM